MQISVELFLSIWGAVLSTLLALGALIKTLRARPIVRATANIRFLPKSNEPRFVVAEVSAGPYGDTIEHEVCVAFEIKNLGEKDILIEEIFVQSENTLHLIKGDGLPHQLAGRTSIEVQVQKEYFDAIDSETRERKRAAVSSTGVVDSLGKRYPISQSCLAEVLDESSRLPTSIGLFKRRDGQEGLVSAFKLLHPAKMIKRS